MDRKTMISTLAVVYNQLGELSHQLFALRKNIAATVNNNDLSKYISLEQKYNAEVASLMHTRNILHAMLYE